MSDSLLIEAALVKVEGTRFTDPTPAANADDIVITDRAWTSIDDSYLYGNERDNAVTGTLLPARPAKPNGRMMTARLAYEPRPKGSAYTAVEDLRGLQACLRACGLSGSVVSSGVNFTFASASLETAAGYFFAGGNRYIGLGMAGFTVIRGEAGQLVDFRTQLTGVMRSDPTAVAVPSITYLTNPAPAVVNASLSDGGWSPDFAWMEMQFGQSSAVRTLKSGNGVDGIGSIRVQQHRPRFRMFVEQAALATRNVYTDINLRTLRTFTTTLGTGTGLQILLQSVSADLAPNGIKKSDFEGFTGYELEYIVTGGTLRFA